MAKNKKKKVSKKEFEERKEKKNLKKKQTEYENKFLKYFLILTFSVIILILFFAFMSNYKKSFEYQNVKFNVVEFCDAGPPCLKTYNTKIPFVYENKPTFYNFYLRNDPRALSQKVPFNGKLVLRENMSIDITFNTYCDGYEQIAIVNFVNLHNVAGISTVGEGGAVCDSTGKSMYVLIQEAEKTSIEQIGPACYVMNVKDCEIIEATERFMIETLIKINAQI